MRKTDRGKRRENDCTILAGRYRASTTARATS
jgi:hypothetical protein